MIITIGNDKHEYSTREELLAIFANYTNIRVGNNFECGHYFRCGGNFECGDYFKCGNSFKCGNNFEPTNVIECPNHYKYIARGFHNLIDGKNYVQLGCYCRKVEDWENDFWNNPNEFQNDGSERSESRKRVYVRIKAFLEL